MKRTVLFFLIFFLVGWVFVPAAEAQAINPIPDTVDFGRTVTDYAKGGKMGKEIYTTNTQALYMDTGTCMILGCSDDPTSPFGYGKSAIASIENIAIAMYANPPADLALWIKDTGQTLGFIPRQVNAQGIGSSGLSGLLPLWKGFRNIAYALLAIVMIVIGFMVMFRKKIDPKTVVTVQNALPKIVLTLLLITFSYAIVGFMIDLMYLAIALIAALLIPVSGNPPALAATTGSTYMNGGFWNLFAMVFGGGLASTKNITNLLLGIGANNVASGVLHWIVSALLKLIVAIALVFAWIRILFLLVGAYIQILISLLIGPLQILTEAFPGSTGFSSWFKNLFANIAVFPITAAMLMIGTILAKFNQNSVAVWTPPLLSSGGANGWTGIIGLGVLFSIPGIANSIKETLKAKAPVNAGPGAMFAPIGSGVSQVMNLAYQGRMIGLWGPKREKEITNPPPSNDVTTGVEAAKGPKV
jgi:hypothetical protein